MYVVQLPMSTGWVSKLGFGSLCVSCWSSASFFRLALHQLDKCELVCCKNAAARKVFTDRIIKHHTLDFIH